MVTLVVVVLCAVQAVKPFRARTRAALIARHHRNSMSHHFPDASLDGDGNVAQPLAPLVDVKKDDAEGRKTAQQNMELLFATYATNSPVSSATEEAAPAPDEENEEAEGHEDGNHDVEDGDAPLEPASHHPTSAVLAPRRRAQERKRKAADRVHPWKLGGEPLHHLTVPGDRMHQLLTTPRTTRKPPSRLQPNLAAASRGYYPGEQQRGETEEPVGDEFTCGYCSKVCKNSRGLVYHQRACPDRPLVHEEDAADDGDDEVPEEQQVTCEYCSKVCKNSRGLVYHQRACPNRPPVHEEDAADDGDDEVPEQQQFTCEYCSKVLKNLTWLSRHQNKYCAARPTAREEDGDGDDTQDLVRQNVDPVMDLPATVDSLRPLFPQASQLVGIKNVIEKIEELCYGHVAQGTLLERARKLCDELGVDVVEA